MKETIKESIDKSIGTITIILHELNYVVTYKYKSFNDLDDIILINKINKTKR